MADPTTPTKGLTLPTQGGDNGVWGALTNANWSLLDTVLGGTLFASITGNVALTPTQAQNVGYVFSGTLTSGSTITWPAFSGFAAIQNHTSGGFSITCAISGNVGTSVTLTSGTALPILSDGRNFIQLSAFAGGMPSTGSGPLVLQNNPLIISPTVSGIITLQGATSGAAALTAPVSGGGTITFPMGNKTLATTLLDNVTLTGDATNTGTAINVVNLSHVNNNSLLPSGLASGFVTIGSTSVNVGSQTSGVSGITGISYASGPSITAGTGSPAGVVQPNSSLYMRADGTTGSRLYVSAGSGVWNAVSGV